MYSPSYYDAHNNYGNYGSYGGNAYDEHGKHEDSAKSDAEQSSAYSSSDAYANDGRASDGWYGYGGSANAAVNGGYGLSGGYGGHGGYGSYGRYGYGNNAYNAYGKDYTTSKSYDEQLSSSNSHDSSDASGTDAKNDYERKETEKKKNRIFFYHEQTNVQLSSFHWRPKGQSFLGVFSAWEAVSEALSVSIETFSCSAGAAALDDPDADLGVESVAVASADCCRITKGWLAGM
ncbi:hypothetical protein HDU83_002615 [Entophlyctis luteolus]|nr:hypothetical protein HDU83_002615 [Entophlyctis luteolus]